VHSRPLSEVLDPRSNGFNTLRLLFAASVIAWHGISLGGYTEPQALRFFSELGVDGFFAISGFLIVRSWCRRRGTARFVWHRMLRILPGFWVCLVVTAASATMVAALSGVDLAAFLAAPHGPLQYVLGNALVQMKFYDIAGTPAAVPYPSYWNTPLWTLRWELLCYAGVVAVGLAGMTARRLNRWVVLPLLVAPMLYGSYLVVAGQAVGSSVRFAAMFAAGSLLYLFGEFVPTSRVVAALAAVVTVPALFLLDDYQPVVAVPLAYLVVAGAATFHSPKLVDRHDISYGLYIYGYVVQQVLAVVGLQRAGYLLFVGVALLVAAAVAVASWLLVERPALRLKDAVLPWVPGFSQLRDLRERAQGGGGGGRPVEVTRR
jgi:peptidoglycan/LPS O-acetylase OafA/YrhL